MSKDTIPEFMRQFWSENPTVYTRDDITHLEPEGENAVFLKYLALINGGGGSTKIRGFITSDDKDFITSNDLIFYAR